MKLRFLYSPLGILENLRNLRIYLENSFRMTILLCLPILLLKHIQLNLIQFSEHIVNTHYVQNTFPNAEVRRG